jgi:hypothetical protein
MLLSLEYRGSLDIKRRMVMTPRDILITDMILLMAKGDCATVNLPAPSIDEIRDVTPQCYWDLLRHAEAALTAIEAAGVVLLPKEPDFLAAVKSLGYNGSKSDKISLETFIKGWYNVIKDRPYNA